MRLPIVVAGMAATGLLAGGVLVLAAEAETTSSSTTPSTSAPLRTVSVEGVAHAPVDSAASSEAAIAAYRQAMAGAITDGQAKAQFLAEKTGATLGQVQSIAEGGGYIECPTGVEYEGAQPDFGSARGEVFAATSAPAARGTATPTIHKASAKGKHHKRHAARKSAAEGCALSTQVTLVYQLG